MSDLDYLLKPLPTTADLIRLREEINTLSQIVDNFVNGKDKDVKKFKAAKERINNLAVLARAAAKRLEEHERKHKFKVCK